MRSGQPVAEGYPFADRVAEIHRLAAEARAAGGARGSVVGSARAAARGFSTSADAAYPPEGLLRWDIEAARAPSRGAASAHVCARRRAHRLRPRRRGRGGAGDAAAAGGAAAAAAAASSVSCRRLLARARGTGAVVGRRCSSSTCAPLHRSRRRAARSSSTPGVAYDRRRGRPRAAAAATAPAPSRPPAGAADKSCDHWHDDAGRRHNTFTRCSSVAAAVDATVTVPLGLRSTRTSTRTRRGARGTDRGSPGEPSRPARAAEGWATSVPTRRGEHVGQGDEPVRAAPPWNTGPTPYVTRYRYVLGLKDGYRCRRAARSR